MRTKVFISWSGERSRIVAEELRAWIPDVIHAVDPWVSGDLDAGVRWSGEIARQLEESRFGIICLTSQNFDKPWIHFEAGALAKTLESTFLVPYLIDLDTAEFAKLKGPLSQFQAIRATKEDTFRLLRSINQLLGADRLSNDRLRRYFERDWPSLDDKLRNLPKAAHDPGKLSLNASLLGLESVHQTREHALKRFSAYLRSEIERARRNEPSRFWIVGSTLRGFHDVPLPGFDGYDVLQEVVRAGCDLRILLTHPDMADLRAEQERRPLGHILSEIKTRIAALRREGVQRQQVRYYRGTPTVFGIATTDYMLLNPYPYERVAMACFSLIVKNTDDPDDIYDQYLVSHFRHPWRVSHEIPEPEWDSGVAAGRGSVAAGTLLQLDESTDEPPTVPPMPDQPTG